MRTQPDTTTQINQASWCRYDWLAVSIIIAIYLIALWLMPIQRSFAIDDDWSYYRAVEQIISGHGYSPPDWAQMTLVFHAYWGALFASVLGLSFTTLTLSTMVMSLTAALAFYAMVRQLGFSPVLTGLGTATLLAHTNFIGLSYSYMTDITFLALMLLSCLCYLKGLPNQSGWLWMGSGFAALALLTRQFALALPMAALLWLLYSKQLSWSRLLAVALLPALTGIVYLLWRSGYPSTTGDTVSSAALHKLLANPGDTLLQQILNTLYWLPFLGLSVPLVSAVRNKLPVIPWAAAMGLALYWLNIASENEERANLAFAEPLVGSPFQLNHTVVWWLGVALTAWLLTAIGARGWPWLQAIVRRQHIARSVDFIYGLGIILALGTFVVSWFAFGGRYQLTIVPMLIIALLYPLRGRSLRQLAPLMVAVAILGAYGVALHLDDYDFYQVQWQAGNYAIQHGASYDKLDDGFAWDGFHFYDAAIQRLGSHDFAKVAFAPFSALDRQYLIATRLKPGYRVVQTFTYFSRLDGFTNHTLLLQQRQQ